MAIHLSIGSGTADPPREDQWSFRNYLLVSLAAAAVVVGVDLLDGSAFARDVDDLLREAEIRNLVGGAGWLDLSIPAVRMPETYVLPWSRLVDLPYALIVWALAPVVGQERAFAAAFALWPPVLGTFYLSTMIACLRRLAPRTSELPVTVLLAMPVFALYSIWEFSPGRIDHHNVQIVLLGLLAYGILRWDQLGGALIGMAASLSLAVGLETLPVLAVALGCVSLAWLLDLKGSTAVLHSTGFACLLVTALLAAALIEPSRYFVAENDTFSAPYLAALAGFGLIGVVITWVIPQDATPAKRTVPFIGVQLALAAAILWHFPSLLHGPLPMLNGLAQTYWFDRIGFEKSLFWLFSARDMRAVLQFLAVFAVLAFAAPIVFRAIARGEPALPILFSVTLTAMAMACTSTRFLRVALGLVTLFLPIALCYLKSRDGAGRGWILIAGCIALVTVLAVAQMYLFPPERERWDAFDYFIRRDCGGEDFSRLGALPSGRIMTPPGLGIEIVHRRLAGLSVSAIPFHRASDAISDVLALMMGRTASASETLLRDFDYVAFCRAPPGLRNEDKLPLLGDLQAGKSVPGLEPLSSDGPIMIFRIDHARRE